MQIELIGTMMGTSGYDIHFRELCNALNKAADIKITTNIQPGQETLLNDAELEMIKKEEKGEINLIITNPLFWKLNTYAKKNWAFLVWEGDKIPDCFIEECLNPEIEYIFVPSEHTKHAVLNTTRDENDYDSLINKLKVIPHGVDITKFYPTEKKDNIFRFIANKGFRTMEDRGGIQYLLKAYFQEFTKEDNVELLVKINPAYGVQNMEQVCKELGFNKNSPKITFDINTYDYKDLIKFYNLGDVFVMPTRAESYGLPLIEAMACGKPVITTDFGGQTDFCNEQNGWIIPTDKTEVTWELQYEGIKWGTPKIRELRKAMREAFEDRETVKRKGKYALETAKQNTWEKTTKKIINLI